MLLFVVASRLGLMSYLDGVELCAGLQSLIVEGDISFDYAIPEYVCRHLQPVYPPQGLQDVRVTCISISGRPHPSHPSTRGATAVHHGLELPEAYSQLEVK